MQNSNDAILLAAGAGIVGALWCASQSNGPSSFLSQRYATECSARRAQTEGSNSISARAAETLNDGNGPSSNMFDTLLTIDQESMESVEAQFGGTRPPRNAHSAEVKAALKEVQPKFVESRSNKRQGVTILAPGRCAEDPSKRPSFDAATTGMFNRPDVPELDD